MSDWALRHKPCPKCGSSDAASMNQDGWWTCFSCEQRWSDGGQTVVADINLDNVVEFVIGEGDHRMTRSLTKQTCERYGIRLNGDRTIFEYRDSEGMITARKVRAGSKENQYTEGLWSDATLFGQHLFNRGGLTVTITEGEFDAAAAYQMFGSKYPVVSVKNGARAALKDCKRNYEWLDSFEKVVVCFDADEAGQQAAKEVAALFAGKARIMKMPHGFKDANELLEHGRVKEFTESFWQAELFTPDGIVAGRSLWSLVNEPDAQPTAYYPWSGLNAIAHGIRPTELVTLTAGSGVGKSAVMRELVYDLILNTQYNIGLIFLEEAMKKTAQSLMSLHLNKRLHLPNIQSTEEERRDAFDVIMGTDRLFFYDHFGSTSVENIVAQVRYLAKAHDCRYIFLDHLSIIVSSQENNDERKAIDEVMTRLRMLTQETGVTLFLVSHLRRPQGQGHEEGKSTSLADLRGSASIAQLSDMVFGFERNGQAIDDIARNTLKVRVLKNRFSGETGLATHLLFDLETGRLKELHDVDEEFL